MHGIKGLMAVLGLVTLAAAWQVPGHFRPWTSFQQQWVAAFGASWIVLAAIVQRRRWEWPGPTLAMLVLAAVPLIQGLSGQIVFVSDWALSALYVLAFAVCIAAGANLIRDEPQRWPDSLMMSLLAGAAISAALALAQWLRIEVPLVSVDYLPPGERVFANLSQPNHLATLLCLGLSASLYLFERRLLGPLAVAVLCVFMGWALVMTQSRTGWVFAGVLVLWWWARRRQLRLRGWHVLAGIASFVAGTSGWHQINDALMLTAPSAGLDERLSSGTRPANWVALIEAALRKPLLGWGWTQVSMAQLAIGTERPVTHEILHNAHNTALDLVVWMGIPATALVLYLVLGWFVGQIRACRDGCRWSYMLSIAAIGIHSLTEYPLDYTYFLLPLGFLVGTAHRWGEVSRVSATARAPVFAVWLVGMGMLFWIAVEYMQVEEAARRVRMVMAGVGVDKVPFVAPPDVKLLDAPREYHKYWNTRATRGMSAEQLDWMKSVAQRNPYPPALLRYALASGLNGRNEEAARMLRAICNLQPPPRCVEARDSWREAVLQYPELSTVALP
jgi:O-antigen ligase